jgi:hypothetical protein
MATSIPRLSVVDAKSGTTLRGPLMIPSENGHLDVHEEMRRLVIEENGEETQVCHNRIIVLDIEGPHVPSIDLVDLPGLLQAPKEAAEASRALVAAQIQEYRKYSIFLAVVQAGRKPTSSSTIRVIEDFELQPNTLGVFTHCDELAETKKQQFRRWLQSPEECGFQDCHYPLSPNGWVATSNAPVPAHNIAAAAADEMLNRKQTSHGSLLRLQQQAQNEMQFFHSEGMDDLVDAGFAGMGALQSRLHKMFSRYLLKSWAPLTFFRLKREREKLIYSLAGLGWPPADSTLSGNALAVMRTKAVSATTEAT